MKAFLKELKFKSTKTTYICDITDDINKAIKKVGVNQGFVFVNTKHTTLGIVINEIAEPNLLEDILDHTLRSIPEDRRSSRVCKDYKQPTTEYGHRCQDNPYCDEVDDDYNAAAHIRALTFSNPSVVVPILNGRLELGKYQQVAAFEFDGRDGLGKNPVRKRIIQVWILPAESMKKID
jgi:thiamine phosphate synthase YjbQ (UPF0047 family)